MTTLQPSTSLLYAASDGRHRPASHPVYAGLPRPTVAVPEPEMPGWRIRALRQVRGWSQYDLARAVGVSRPAVAQWEADLYRPSDEHMAVLRRVLR